MNESKSILIDKDIVIIRLGKGELALSTAANIETNKNYCLIISPAGRKTKIGTELKENIGVMADRLPFPQVRIEFDNAESILVMIRQLKKIKKDFI